MSVYTIGYTMSYDVGLKDLGENFKKAGRDMAVQRNHIPSDYPGGIIFETVKLAEKYIEAKRLRGYAIYEVDADWNNDCEIDENDGELAFWKHLMITSQILRKVCP